MILDAHVNAPEKPFFLYYATGAARAAHHVEKEWIEKYKGRFDEGWDSYREQVFRRQQEIGLLPASAHLPERDADVPEWDTLSPDERGLYARFMEIYAGFLSQTEMNSAVACRLIASRRGGIAPLLGARWASPAPSGQLAALGTLKP